MGIEEGSITGHIQGLPIEEGASYLAQDEFTDENGELVEILISRITESSYFIDENDGSYYLLKSKVITAPEDFNSKIHRFKLIEQL